MGFDVVAVTEGATSREEFSMRAGMGQKRRGTGFRLSVVAAALGDLASTVDALAAAEDLPAHARAVRARLDGTGST